MAGKTKAKTKSETTSVIKSDAVADYEKTAVKLKDGTTRHSRDSGDEVAVKLRGKTMEDLATLAEKEGFGDAWKDWDKRGLNDGMKRMNLGNKMRAKIRAKEAKKAA